MPFIASIDQFDLVYDQNAYFKEVNDTGHHQLFQEWYKIFMMIVNDCSCCVLTGPSLDSVMIKAKDLVFSNKHLLVVP